MATSSTNRDVRLGVEIQTTGEAGLKSLADAIRALGREGGPAADQFSRLATELDRLAQQGDAVQGLQALRSDVERLTEAERQAVAAAAAVSARYNEQAAATNALREAQILASAEVNEARAALIGMTAELDRQRAASRAAGLSGKELAAATEEARLNVINQTEALRRRNLALGEANAAVSRGEAAERRLAAQFTSTNAAAGASISALASKTAALGAAEAAAESLGVATGDLAAAERLLVESARGIAASAAQAESELRESAEAMAFLERSAREADAQMEALAGSLRQTEAAARGYTEATERAAAAGAGDAAAARNRVQAAESLIASERELTAAQRQLAAERDRGRQALLNEAQALLTQTRALESSREATARLVRDSTALGTALDGTGRSIGRIGTLTEQAFGQTGVRSLQAIEGEIADVERAMSLLERRFRSGQISADDLARATGSAQVKLAALKREAVTIPGDVSAFERINTSITGLLSRFGALTAAIATVGVAVRPVLEASIALEQMRRVLTTVTGSAEQAQQQINFLRVVSQQSGQQFDQLGASYAKFAASALQSGLSIQQTQEVFRSVALAAGNLGLSSDQAKRALEALSQIASKGTVNMEELRQQLGDALPGVLPLLAKELGLTQAQLIKLVESGQLLAAEAIPAIGRSLTALQPQSGVVNGLVASWNRFINVVKEAGTTIVEGPLGSAAGVVISAFAGVIRDLSVVAVGASEAMKLLGLTTLSVLDALRGNITFTQLKDQINDFALQSAERLDRFKTTAYGAGEGAQSLGTSLGALGSSFAKLAIDQQTAIDQATLGAQTAEKRVQAAKAEAEAINTVAELTGLETEKRLAAVAASQQVLLATEAQLAADQRVLITLQQTKAATEAKAAAEGIGREAIKATVDELDKKIAKAQADVEKTQAQTNATRAQAAAFELAAQSASNNAGRIVALRAAVDQASIAFNDKVRAMAADRATSEQVRSAAEALARAKGLLRDAIEDVSEALERQLAAMRAEAQLAAANLRLQIEQTRERQRAAAAQGLETQARAEGIRVLELEQELAKLNIDLKKQEAEATIRSLELQREELRALGQLTPEKEKELNTRIKVAEAMRVEAQANRVANGEKQIEIDLLKAGGTAYEQYIARLRAAQSAAQGDTAAQRSNTTAREANTTAIRNQIEALNTYGETSGVSRRNTELTTELEAADKTRNAQNAAGAAASGQDVFFDLQRKLQNGTLAAGDLALAQTVFENARVNLTTAQQNQTAFSIQGFQDEIKRYNEARRILEQVTQLAAESGLLVSPTPAPPPPQTKPGTAPAPEPAPTPAPAPEPKPAPAPKPPAPAPEPAPAPAPTGPIPIPPQIAAEVSTVRLEIIVAGSTFPLVGTQSDVNGLLQAIEDARRNAGVVGGA